MQVEFNLIHEAVPGSKWLHWFNHYWPVYRAWFLSQGESQRPTYRQVIRALEQHMPEIVHNIENMTELAGGGDHTARFLGQYCPPPFFAACSQAILNSGEPVLIRNYDYSPRLFDGLIINSRWNKRSVLGMSDCMSGLVDGMNDAGLVISLAFGGRKEVGPGFGIGLVQRYILETCDNVEQAIEALKRIPLQISYNVAILDHDGNHATLALSPDNAPVINQNKVSTNHQPSDRWEKYTDMIETDKRYDYLTDMISRDDIESTTLTSAFLEEPLFRNSFDSGYGTLYTAAYYPTRKEVHYLWKGHHKICRINHTDEWSETIRYSNQEMDATPLWPGVHQSLASLGEGFVIP
jgi:predicted choloylglycine hydrolase